VDKHLLRSLICPKAQCPSSTLHYDVRAQAAENTGLVVFGRVQIRNDHIIWIGEVHIAGRADGSLSFTLTRELASIGAVNAEDMAAVRLVKTGLGEELQALTYLHVVTTAWSLSSLRHFSELHLSVNSMPNAMRKPREAL
jgi:hypothetical protein